MIQFRSLACVLVRHLKGLPITQSMIPPPWYSRIKINQRLAYKYLFILNMASDYRYPLFITMNFSNLHPMNHSICCLILPMKSGKLMRPRTHKQIQTQASTAKAVELVNTANNPVMNAITTPTRDVQIKHQNRVPMIHSIAL